MRGANWTDQEETKLAELALEGYSPQQIAAKLDRSVNAIHIRFEEVVRTRTRWAQMVKLLKDSSNDRSETA